MNSIYRDWSIHAGKSEQQQIKISQAYKLIEIDMLNILRQPVTILSWLIVLYFTSGCRVDSKKIAPLYTGYQFDTNVIHKLALYDSLVAGILEKYSFFQQHINEKDSYRSFKYMPLSHELDVVKKLPPEVAPKIDKYFAKLGKDFIYGFDVFKDSTVKIYIRRSRSDSFQVDILENLSYLPSGDTMRHRMFPDKDTILNKHWQYWIGFYRSRLTFLMPGH